MGTKKKSPRKKKERVRKEKSGCLGNYLRFGWIISGILWTYFGIRMLIVEVDFLGIFQTASGLFFIGFVIYKAMRLKKKHGLIKGNGKEERGKGDAL